MMVLILDGPMTANCALELLRRQGDRADPPRDFFTDLLHPLAFVLYHPDHSDDGLNQRLPALRQPCIGRNEGVDRACFDASVPFVVIDVPLGRLLILGQHLTQGEQFGLIFLYLHQHVSPA